MQVPRFDSSRWIACCAVVSVVLLLVPAGRGMAQDSRFTAARSNAKQFERTVASARRLLHAWLAHADTRTLLLPDRPLADRSQLTYTPHNSGADLYPYSDSHGTAHRSRPLQRANDGDAAQRGRAHHRSTLDPGKPEARHIRNRPGQLFRRGRVRERRLDRGDRVSRPHTMVLPHGRHDGRCDDRCPGGLLLRRSAGGRRRNQRRLLASVGAPCRHDRRRALPRPGRGASATHTSRRSCRGAAVSPASPGTSRRTAAFDACACAITATKRSSASPCSMPWSISSDRRVRRNTGRSSRTCSIACWPRPTLTGCSTTR